MPTPKVASQSGRRLAFAPRIACFLASACAPSRVGEHRASEVEATIVSADPVHVDLGVLAPGPSASSLIRLNNDSDLDVSLDRFVSSCPCIRLEGPRPSILEPGKSAGWRVVFDPDEDPGFHGRLRVPVEAWDGTNRLMARLLVSLRVR